LAEGGVSRKAQTEAWAKDGPKSCHEDTKITKKSPRKNASSSSFLRDLRVFVVQSFDLDLTLLYALC